MEQDWLAIADDSDFLLLLFCLDKLNAFFDRLHFVSMGRAPCAGRYGIKMVAGRITLVAGGDQDATSTHFCTIFHRTTCVDSKVI